MLHTAIMAYPLRGSAIWIWEYFQMRERKAKRDYRMQLQVTQDHIHGLWRTAGDVPLFSEKPFVEDLSWNALYCMLRFRRLKWQRSRWASGQGQKHKVFASDFVYPYLFSLDA